MKPMLFRSLGAGLILLICVAVPVFGAGERDLPERKITMSLEYTGVVVPPDENVSMDLIFHNRGRSDENVNVRLAETPDGWKARIKTYQFGITGLHVPSDDNKQITFEAVPDKGIPAGDYAFKIEAETPDGVFKMAQSLTVTVKEKTDADKEVRGVEITTSYPVLRGPSDGEFEFSMEVSSRLDRDAVFDLFAQGPEGWDVNFKPAYESKFISSLRIKANQSSTVAVQVKPAVNAAEGEYPLTVRVGAGSSKAEAGLTVILTGTYKLEVGTTEGLLSLDARAGKPANVSFYVRNNGTAVNKNISFMSFKPENWKVEFNPEKIEALEPDALKQVEMTLTPYGEALVGDYSVTVKVDGEKSSKDLEFRVTVKASAAWAGVGIAIIVLVVFGLSTLFRKLGRR